ncbi:MAG: hypothetical protein JW941_03810 [Candidatus Coatesbacteria bacterium]|nr:hypothetical protein [Candidatus Coatesbacteria bacterium]
MSEISEVKEEVVAALANAEDRIQHMRDHLMSVAFRSNSALAKEYLLQDVKEAMSLMQPGVDKLTEILDEIES